MIGICMVCTNLNKVTFGVLTKTKFLLLNVHKLDEDAIFNDEYPFFTMKKSM